MIDDPKVKRSIIITLTALSLFLFTKFVSEIQSLRFIGSSPTQQSLISVNGNGSVVGVPDIATFSFSVTEESLLVKEAQDSAAEKTNAIIAYLTGQGVAKKDIQTSGYNIYPRYEYGTAGSAYPYPQGKQKLAAYVVTQSIMVKVRDIGTAGEILGGIGELGTTDVSGLSFDFDKRDDLVKEARDKAITEARSEAAKLAKSLGVRLVRIVSYSEGGNYPIYAMKEMSAPMANGRGGAAPEVPVGEQKIQSNVAITYEVK